jgi:hypothetical protein
MNARRTRTTIPVILLGISIASVAANQLIDYTRIPGGVTETPVREALLLEKGGGASRKPMLPQNSVSYSNIVYDVVFGADYTGPLPYVDGMVADPHGRYSHSIRFKLSVEATMSFDARTLKGGDYSIKVVDRHGLPLYRKTDRLVLPADEVSLAPGLYVIHVDSSKGLQGLRFRLHATRGGGNQQPTAAAWHDKLGEVRIWLDAASQTEIRRVVDIAMSSPGGAVITVPSVRVAATLTREDGQKLPARVGLSGRTREHLQWFPSIDVKLAGQGAYRGMKSFKLYRLETKSGVEDLVFLSTLADMGFFVPRQDMVRLYVNGVKSGLYVLMETSWTTTFAARQRLDGNVVGTEPDALFPDYPFGTRLVNRFFHNTAGGGRKDASRDFPVSKDFLRVVDVDGLTRYLAFTATYLASHGLGVDDLRFYEDPTTGRMSPIPRDLNPGLWNLEDRHRAFRTHFAWQVSIPPYTVWPIQWLISGAHEFDKQRDIFLGVPELSTAIGFADIHYSVPMLFSKPENLALANRYIEYFSRNESLRHILTNRMILALRYLQRQEPGLDYIKEQLGTIKAKGIASLAEMAGEQVSRESPRFGEGDEIYRWNLRTSVDLRADVRPSFFAPIKHGLGAEGYREQLTLAFLCERNIYALLAQHGNEEITPSFSAVHAGYRNPKAAIDIGRRLNAMRRARPSDAGKGFDKDVVTYLDTWLGGNHATILFLVRNTTNINAYKLETRDSGDVYSPTINATFRLAASAPRGMTSTRAIMGNRFSVGETLRLLVFDVPLSDSPWFYRLRAPAGSNFLVPAYMYVPARSRATTTSPTLLPPREFTGNQEGYRTHPGDRIMIDSSVVFPPGTSLTIAEGTAIVFGPGGSMTISGDLRILGSKARPVTFSGEGNRSWSGLYVVGMNERRPRVVIRNATFDNAGSFPKTVINGRSLNSGLSFVHVDADMEDVRITNSHGEDAINFVSSVATLKRLQIENTVSDAIDLDFSDADISGLDVTQVGGDGLDVSNSLVLLSSSRIAGAADKCVSAGEMSHVVAMRSTLANCAMGVGNKDQSRIEVVESRFEGNDIAVSEYIKKPYFGRPTSVLTGNSLIRNGQDYQWLGYHR